MFPGPVFQYEMMTQARRPRYYVARFLYGSLLLFLIWWNAFFNAGGFTASTTGEVSIHESGWLGRAIFLTFWATQSVVILVMTPALFAGLIADERQRKTLHDLLASSLSSGEIVLGKLAARMLQVGVLLAVGLPIFSVLTFLGGVQPQDVILVFAASASSAFFLAALSVLVSVHAKRAREAVSLTYSFELVWLFGPSLLGFFMPMAGGAWFRVYETIRPANQWLGAGSPFFVLMNAMPWGMVRLYEAVAWMIGLHLIAGVLFLAAAVARLRPIHRAGESEGGRLQTVLSRRARHWLPRPGCGDDGLLWKEMFVSRSSPITKIAASFVFLGVVGLIGYAASNFAGSAIDAIRLQGYWDAVYSPAHSQFNVFLRTVATAIFVCWVFGTAGAAAAALTGEREGDTWVSLIATPLTPSEIVRAKMLGAFWTMRWLGMLWFAFTLTGLALGAVHPLGFAAALIVTAVNVWFAGALGLAFSLHARSSARALMATVGTLICCNGVYLLLLIPFPVVNAFRFLGVSPFVAAISLMSYENMRWLLERPTGYRELSLRADLIITAVASVLAYGLAAWSITAYLVWNFDDAIDRPWTLGGRRIRKAFDEDSLDDPPDESPPSPPAVPVPGD